LRVWCQGGIDGVVAGAASGLVWIGLACGDGHSWLLCSRWWRRSWWAALRRCDLDPGTVVRPDLRFGVSASDRERPLVAGVNGTATLAGSAAEDKGHNGVSLRSCPTGPQPRVTHYEPVTSLLTAVRGQLRGRRASISTGSPQVLHPASARPASAGARPATRERRERKVRRCSWIS